MTVSWTSTNKQSRILQRLAMDPYMSRSRASSNAIGSSSSGSQIIAESHPNAQINIFEAQLNTAPSGLDKVPQEIVDMIIENFDSLQALLNARLAYRKFANNSQTKLFAKVKFSPADPSIKKLEAIADNKVKDRYGNNINAVSLVKKLVFENVEPKAFGTLFSDTSKYGGEWEEYVCAYRITASSYYFRRVVRKAVWRFNNLETLEYSHGFQQEPSGGPGRVEVREDDRFEAIQALDGELERDLTYRTRKWEYGTSSFLFQAPKDSHQDWGKSLFTEAMRELCSGARKKALSPVKVIISSADDRGLRDLYPLPLVNRGRKVECLELHYNQTRESTLFDDFSPELDRIGLHAKRFSNIRHLTLTGRSLANGCAIKIADMHKSSPSQKPPFLPQMETLELAYVTLCSFTSEFIRGHSIDLKVSNAIWAPDAWKTFEDIEGSKLRSAKLSGVHFVSSSSNYNDFMDAEDGEVTFRYYGNAWLVGSAIEAISHHNDNQRHFCPQPNIRSSSRTVVSPKDVENYIVGVSSDPFTDDCRWGIGVYWPV